MALTPGTRLGVYEITAQIGEGGMGQVFRATDTKLKRQVAIKSLPPAVAADAERLARFQREAEVLASLNHPNIAAIYGLEESGGLTALVMELVEGDDLSQRIARGAIPIDEALPIAKQIADALEAAHEQGIIHRDLKPANIKVRADGTVKVLDFGLAKAMEPGAGSSPSVSMSPTLSIHATQAGIILGSAAYMSPEQASGKPVDKRSDIWSFGVVLFEMLTGQRLFDGETISHTLADVLRGPIEFSQLPGDTPKMIRDLLRRCLNRDVKKRTRDIGEARIQIEDVLSGASEGTASPGTVAPVPSRTSERILWASTLALVAIAAAAGALAWGRGRASAVPPPAETRLEIATPATSDPFSFAISPDGRRVVFAAPTHGGVSQLWLRPLEAATAQPLPGTEGASFPFWSPDSRSVGFFAGGALKRLDLGRGLPQTLATSPGNRGGTWSADGVILFQPSTAGPISRVPAAGGEVVAVTKLSAGHASHRFPQFLPGGRQFLFYASGSDEAAGIYLGSLDAVGAKRVTPSDTAGAYAPLGSPGWLFFTRQGALVARRFDATRGELTGDPVTVADPVGVDSNVFIGAFSVSATGLVTYRTAGTAPNQLTWFDRAGKPLGTLGAPDSTQFDPALSPDGRRVAVSRTAQGNTDIWLIDTARTSRLTFDPSTDRYPRWSPDGSRIVFSNNRKGVFDLYQKSSNSAGTETLLLESPQTKWAQSWSPDGRFLLYGASFPKTNFDLWVLPIAADAKPFPFVNSTYNEGLGAYSPDGHWVAYMSSESGQSEIYVRPFPPGPGGQSPVSTSGGASPRWRPDGKELYYIAPDSKLMAVPIVVKGNALEAGLPIALFQPRVAAFGATTGYLQQFDVASDGRFLINSTTDGGGTAPITVIENWQPEATK